MCGIFGLVTEDNDAPIQVFKGLKDIEYRGYDSWGIAFAKKGSFIVQKETGFLPSSTSFLNGTLALGHTRWATHGGVTVANAHPHLDCSGKLVLVHNGIVENYLQLKQKLKTHQFKSETDSEIIIHAIEDEMHSKMSLKEAVSTVFNRLEGFNALVVSDGKEIVACKIGSPLVVGKLPSGYAVASDPNALLPLTRDLLFIEDGQLVVFNGSITLYEVENLKELPVQFSHVEWDYKSASLDEYPHYMLKEVEEQPKVLRTLSQNIKQFAKVAKMIDQAYGTFLIGCGSAAFSCLAGVYLFSKFAKKHVNFSIGSEFTYIEDYLTPESLLIAVSQSGETMDVVEPVTNAKKKGSKVVALTNTLGSTLYRLSDHPLLLSAGVEKAVCSTKAFIAMVASQILLSFCLSEKPELGQSILEKSADEIESILSRKEQISQLADTLLDKQHIYLLGRGLSYPVALESALKIKEIAYIHAEGFASGELKHGVIALIEKGTPVIVFVPNDETKDVALANAMEVKARGAYVIGIGVENNPVFDFYFQVKDCGASSIIPHVVFSQVLAYFLSTKLGYNPDKPRNLAKSVVVR